MQSLSRTEGRRTTTVAAVAAASDGRGCLPSVRRTAAADTVAVESCAYTYNITSQLSDIHATRTSLPLDRDDVRRGPANAVSCARDNGIGHVSGVS